MVEVEQLSLFEILEVNSINSPYSFEINERVQIIIPEHKLNDSETFFYLQDFLKKRGTVLKVLEHKKLQYEVEVGKE
ncbi:hypothetical protein [Sporosarcina sp. FSL K6-1508]|uniref:hypothetical protein n=1 Tax=Sporosarcina sp. FSL K6-1508 TaxID=2921553 RepID=UPI0030FCD374